MAVGTPPKKGNKKKKIQVTISYEGKKPEEEILKLDKANIISILKEDNKNELYFGDNLQVMSYLLASGYKGKINLIYIDPPFATSFNFKNKEQNHAYSDILSGGEYVEFLRERIILLKELLAYDGSIYLHLDNNMAFTMKIIMDEIFGENNCRAFITRKKCSTKNTTKNTYGNISDYIMFYTKSDKYTWNRPFEPWELDKMIEQYPYIDEKGRRYKKVPIHAPGERNGETGKEWKGMLPPKGKHWQYTPSKLDELDAAGEIYWSATGNPRRIVFCNPAQGIPIQDIWLNYRDSINQSQKTTGYPTEKNYDMLKMIISASSNPNDLVMDCFAGSGTTLGASFDLGRNWIGIDNSLESFRAILKRFKHGLETHGDYVSSSYKIKKNSQKILDFVKKCKFSISSTKNHESLIKEIISDFD